MAKFRIRVTTEVEVNDWENSYPQPITRNTAKSLVSDLKWTLEHSDYGSRGEYTVEDINVEFLDHQINSKDSLTIEGQ